jgi:F-type H+-transporting ATPase subunit epsilon
MNDATAENFDFELVSPERKLMSEKAWQVTIPGQEGNFGVRANHSSVVSSIRPGVVEIISTQGAAPTKIFIAGGFADVTASNCIILAEEAMMLEDLNQDQIEKDIADLEKSLAATKDKVKQIRFTKQLEMANAKLTAVTGTIAA